MTSKYFPDIIDVQIPACSGKAYVKRANITLTPIMIQEIALEFPMTHYKFCILFIILSRWEDAMAERVSLQTPKNVSPFAFESIWQQLKRGASL